MTAKELIEKLSKVTPDTEIIGGLWNGRMDTYTVMDELHVIPFDDIIPDFYGTPGAFDDKMLQIRSKEVVYIGSLFESLDKQVVADRRVTWRMQRILHMHRSKEWKKEQIYKFLQEFDGIADMHCRSDEYLADELMLELTEKSTPNTVNGS